MITTCNNQGRTLISEVIHLNDKGGVLWVVPDHTHPVQRWNNQVGRGRQLKGEHQREGLVRAGIETPYMNHTPCNSHDNYYTHTHTHSHTFTHVYTQTHTPHIHMYTHTVSQRHMHAPKTHYTLHAYMHVHAGCILSP